MASCKIHVTWCNLQDASCKIQVARCKLQVTSCNMQAARCKLQDADYKTQVARYALPDGSCKMQVKNLICKMQIVRSKLQDGSCNLGERRWVLPFPLVIKRGVALSQEHWRFCLYLKVLLSVFCTFDFDMGADWYMSGGKASIELLLQWTIFGL